MSYDGASVWRGVQRKAGNINTHGGDGVVVREGDGGVGGLHEGRPHPLRAQGLDGGRESPIEVVCAEAIHRHQDLRTSPGRTSVRECRYLAIRSRVRPGGCNQPPSWP